MDLIQGDILSELDGQGLAVAAHGSDAHAQAIDGHGIIAAPEDLVALHLSLPLFLALTTFQLYVNPRDQRTGQRHRPGVQGITIGAYKIRHLFINLQNRRGGIVDQRLDLGVDRAHLPDQLAHIARAGAGSGLIGHGRDPFH